MNRRKFIAVTLGLFAQVPLRAFGATKKPSPTPKTTPTKKPAAKPTIKPSAQTVKPTSTPSPTSSTPQVLPVLRAGMEIKLDDLVAPISFYATVTKSGREYPLLVSKPTERTIKVFTARCPHQGYILNLSKLGEFTCDQHGARFNDATGKVLAGPTINSLESYEVIERSGSLYISL